MSPFGETERVRARDFAAKLSMRVLSRMWQMLLKGIEEVEAATGRGGRGDGAGPDRHVADLPTPDEAIRMLDQNGGGSQIASGGAAPSRGGARRQPVLRCLPPSPMRTPSSPPLRRGSVRAAANGGAVGPNQSAPVSAALPLFRSLSPLPARSAIS